MTTPAKGTTKVLTGGVVVHLAHLGAHLHQFLVGPDAGQDFGLFIGIGADVLSLAGAVVLGGVDEVEVAGLAIAVLASVRGGQDRLKLFEAVGLDELRHVAVVALDRFGGCVPVGNLQPQEGAKSRHYVGRGQGPVCGGQCCIVIACLPCAFAANQVQYGQ
jgi:hypothetical protein